MFNWIHLINSKEEYEKIWEVIINYRELHLEMFIMVEGSLTLKDGRIFGNEGEKFAGIITYTYEKETMERMINSGIIDSSRVVLFEDLPPEEVDPESEYTSGIKKEIKNFEGPSAFETYLEKIHYKDFKEED